MKELAEIRRELDDVDRDIVRLFEKRMLLSQDVAACKLSRGTPVLDAAREAEVLASRVDMLGDSRWAESVCALYREIMRLSRMEQQRILKEADSHA